MNNKVQVDDVKAIDKALLLLLDAGMSGHEIVKFIRLALVEIIMERNGNNRADACRKLKIQQNSFRAWYGIKPRKKEEGKWES